jgi:glycosyltransferase involved in cell wall biosynthesis
MQVAARDTANVLANLGHEVHVFTTSCDNQSLRERFDGNLVIHFSDSPKGKYSTEYFDKSFEKFLQIGGFDLVYSHSSAGRRHLGGDIPVVAHWHGIGSQQDALNLRKLGIPCEDKKFDTDILNYPWHIAIAPHEADLIVDNGGDPNRIRVIPAGRGGVYPKDPTYMRNELGIKPDQFCVGIVGRLVPDKGIGQLLPLLDLLPAHVVILAVGSGPFSGELFRHPKVIFRPSEPPDKMADYYSAMDLYLNLTARNQGFDLTAIEASLCELPLLLSDVGSYRKVFPDALFFRLGDLTELFFQIVESSYRKNRKPVGRLDRFTPDAMGRSIEEYLTEILGR